MARQWAIQRSSFFVLTIIDISGIGIYMKKDENNLLAGVPRF
jgi:hypothetical protein